MNHSDLLPQPHGLLRLELLTLPRLLRDNAPVLHLERRDAALLALLALEGSVTRSRAATMLWPDSDAKRANISLRQRLFRLKRAAGRDVSTGDRHVSLAAGIELDLNEQPSIERAVQASVLLGSADYTDLPELSEWIDRARARWQEARRRSMIEWAARCEAEGRLAQAIELAERLAIDDPSVEHMHRRVMRLHYLRGDRAGALAAFARCQVALRRELDVAPGRETMELASMIERSGFPKLSATTTLRPVPLALRRPPRLAGRDREWQALVHALGQGVVVLIEGESGIGKTRMLQDFASATGSPPPAAARAGDDAVPYALLSRWMSSLSEHFGVPADEAAARELSLLLPGAEPSTSAPDRWEPTRLLRAIEAALTCWRRRFDGGGVPTLLLDDLQFADMASLDIVFDVIPIARTIGWGWAMAYRVGSEPVPLKAWHERRAPGEALRLALHPLDEAGLVEFLDALELPGLDARSWAKPLMAYCGAHPFFVLEALQALHANGQKEFAGPPQLAALGADRCHSIASRMDRLASDERHLVQVAAAAGQDFGVELAASVLGCQPIDLASPWRNLELQGLFRSGGFAHDLVRQAALNGLPAAVEAALHAQIARWLAGQSDAHLRTARRAAHWDAAGNWREAATSYEQLAHDAHHRSARHEELQALRAAARCHRAAGEAAAIDAAFDCECRAARLVLSLESANHALTFADDLLARAVRTHQRAAALEVRAHVLCERLEPEAALVAAREAGELARAAGDTRLQVLASQRAAAALSRLARSDEALAEQLVHRDALDRLNDEERLLWLSDHATALDYADRRCEALAVFDLTIEQAERLHRWGVASEAWGNKAVALMYLNRLADSIAALRRAMDCSQHAGSERGNLLIDEMSLLGSLRDIGHFGDYLARAEALPPDLRDAGYPVWAYNAENDLAMFFLWLGRPELARRALTPVPEEQPAVMRAARLFVEARLQRGLQPVKADPDARRLVERARDLIEAAGGTGRSYVRLKVALELAKDEEPATALAHVAAIETDAIEREQRMLAMHALTYRVDLLCRLGAREPAAEAATLLLQRCLNEGLSAGLYAPEVWWTVYQGLAPVDPIGAASALDRGRAWIHAAVRSGLPEAFHRSFLHRNPINRMVLTTADRLLPR